jgi:phosphate transport system protein
LFCAKNIERIGDHVTNISETIYFLVNGTRLRAERPRGGAHRADRDLSDPSSRPR